MQNDLLIEKCRTELVQEGEKTLLKSEEHEDLNY